MNYWAWCFDSYVMSYCRAVSGFRPMDGLHTGLLWRFMEANIKIKWFIQIGNFTFILYAQDKIKILSNFQIQTLAQCTITELKTKIKIKTRLTIMKLEHEMDFLACWHESKQFHDDRISQLLEKWPLWTRKSFFL